MALFSFRSVTAKYVLLLTSTSAHHCNINGQISSKTEKDLDYLVALLLDQVAILILIIDFTQMIV